MAVAMKPLLVIFKPRSIPEFDEAIEKITSVIPGMKSPTIMPLGRQGWSSLHSVVNENDFWEVVEKLKLAGAEGILVVSIDQMIN